MYSWIPGLQICKSSFAGSYRHGLKVILDGYSALRGLQTLSRGIICTTQRLARKLMEPRLTSSTGLDMLREMSTRTR
jgi:hypothetical protein